ncbi:MAG: DUF2207 domain-containing protein [Elusimicrobiaceae bacterium]|nr:DUF2207 domain-containing protein [Elusimicrobiaceae bacterium]
MKKLFLFFILFPFFAFAQNWNDPEKIYLFDVQISVQTNGEIQVTENITLNVKHQQIRRGIYRDLPELSTEYAHPISLTMDDRNHPFFTERKGNYKRVNFGDDNYISEGKHTYSFVYSYTGAINFLQNYDELYWNVTGNDWNFSIDKAQVTVSFPYGTEIMENGISLYTGKKGEKGHNAKESGYLTFETTSPLSPREGFTIAIPFEKGVISQPAVKSSPAQAQFAKKVRQSGFSFGIFGGLFSEFRSMRNQGLSKSTWVFVILFVVLIAYCFITWFLFGRDPFYPAVPQYKPPKNVSPALLCYLKKGSVSDILTCAILSLAMKGYIKIQETEKKVFFLKSKKITMFLLKHDISELPPEEEIIVLNLFRHGFCVLSAMNSYTLENVGKEIKRIFDTTKKEYIIPNNLFQIGAILLFLALIAPNFYSVEYLMAFMFFAVFLWNTIWNRNIMKWIIIIFIPFILMMFGEGTLIGIIIVFVYIKLIPNVTPAGKEIFDYIPGFEKYIKTAESHRFEASEPLDHEKIFCDYLPYAYALGLYNKWIAKFSAILSQYTVQEKLSHTYGMQNIRSLSNYVAASMPSSGGGGGGGSFGGGSSGGGHGGGGGGGR